MGLSSVIEMLGVALPFWNRLRERLVAEMLGLMQPA